MKAIVQRVSEARVTVGNQVVGQIERGVLVLLGVTHGDDETKGQWLAEKIAKLRIFPDEGGNMNRSLRDIHGDALVVSQFTLHARVRKGTRPSFNDAAPPELAETLYEGFLVQLQSALGGRRVAHGQFGAMMQVTLTNDGPVTLVLDTESGI